MHLCLRNVTSRAIPPEDRPVFHPAGCTEEQFGIDAWELSLPSLQRQTLKLGLLESAFPAPPPFDPPVVSGCHCVVSKVPGWGKQEFLVMILRLVVMCMK